MSKYCRNLVQTKHKTMSKINLEKVNSRKELELQGYKPQEHEDFECWLINILDSEDLTDTEKIKVIRTKI